MGTHVIKYIASESMEHEVESLEIGSKSLARNAGLQLLLLLLDKDYRGSSVSKSNEGPLKDL